MAKKAAFLTILAMVGWGLAAGTAQAGYDPSYGIDSIYDNANTNWLETTPTFVGGQTYDVTIEGHGDHGSFLNVPIPPQSFVSMGAFIDYYGTGPTNWNTFPDAPVVSGPSADVPYFQSNKEYTVNGSFTVPNDVTTKSANAMAWMNSSYLNPPDTAKEAKSLCALDKEYLTVNLESNVVPEPSTLALLGLGLAGGFFKRFRKQS